MKEKICEHYKVARIFLHSLLQVFIHDFGCPEMTHVHFETPLNLQDHLRNHFSVKFFKMSV